MTTTPTPSSPVQAQRGTDERERLIALFEGLYSEWPATYRMEKKAADMLRADANLREQLAARSAEVEALRADALRYRWLRTQPIQFNPERITPLRPDKFDAYIDAALQEKHADLCEAGTDRDDPVFVDKQIGYVAKALCAIDGMDPTERICDGLAFCARWVTYSDRARNLLKSGLIAEQMHDDLLAERFDSLACALGDFKTKRNGETTEQWIIREATQRLVEKSRDAG